MELGDDTHGNQDRQVERDENQTIIQGKAHPYAAPEAGSPQDGRHLSRLTDPETHSIFIKRF